MVYNLAGSARRTLGGKGFLDFAREEEEFEARRRQRQMQEQMMPLQMQKAQLEMEALKRKMDSPDFDLQGETQRALMKYHSGGELSPRDMAVLQTSVALNPGKTQYKPDASGRVQAITTPNPLQAILQQMGGQQVSQAPARTPTAAPQVQGRAAALDQRGTVPLNQAQVEGLIGGTDYSQPGGMSTPIDPYYATGPKAQAAGGKKLMEGQAEIATAQGMLPIKEEFAESELARKIRFEKEKRELQKMTEQEKAEKAKEMAASANRIYQDATLQDIDDSLRILQSNPDAAGTLSGAGALIKESPAGRLNSLLLTVQGGVGFGRLGKMRESSPTGASGLGALSKPEMDLLQASLGEMKVTTDPNLLARNLMRYHNTLMDTIHGTPQQIQSMIDEGVVPEEVARPLMKRYDFGSMTAPLSAAEQQELQQLRAKYGRR